MNSLELSPANTKLATSVFIQCLLLHEEQLASATAAKFVPEHLAHCVSVTLTLVSVAVPVVFQGTRASLMHDSSGKFQESGFMFSHFPPPPATFVVSLEYRTPCTRCIRNVPVVSSQSVPLSVHRTCCANSKVCSVPRYRISCAVLRSCNVCRPIRCTDTVASALFANAIYVYAQHLLHGPRVYSLSRRSTYRVIPNTPVA